ncbi:MAG: DNA-protecting protein DprA [Candidatus Magasanikbacteria bacterium CG_4_10_14_0_2_um_filter_37_12]|uniref:DNA-protecting protein DprA n=1 Tax=Candidatus Magasanikbacteria bacterium CG_4_10_14_0_2_um_filter_37_12 TaxID=1974637 RepID=A0A2M7V6Y9_9BACT|nr:MAG: DNA-protecting protein DprA [Candidatus Magasanikbacteria bacterium CG_4_10_14_0_2_um_filter_37_12]
MDKQILLSYFPKITVNRYQQLLAVFYSLDEVWKANLEELKKSKWNEEIITEFINWRKKIDEDKIQKILDIENIRCITKDNPEYPELLKNIYDPPFCLFVRGKIKKGFNLAVVGTRKYTPYGKQVTEELVSELALQGVNIISGLAFGIDGIAHSVTISHHGHTVAVLGSGINKSHIYPSVHSGLSEKIIEMDGAIISEYPPGALPSKFTFPRRNRIIAGMSLGTLVIEAPEKSGALITAECALNDGREVFAIPQNITSHTAVGPNNLIKMGAKMVTSAKDILEALNLQDIEKYVTNKQILPESPAEARLLEYLSRQPLHVDELTKKSKLPSPEVNATLTMMEMKGKVRNVGNMNYVLSR